MASVRKSCNKTIAHLTGVRDAVRAEADAGAERARAALAGHRETGASSIEVTYGRTDSLVELVDPEDAVAIEFGRAGYTREDGRQIGPMEGLHILGEAFGISRG